jgi:hypothetical protein
VVFWEVTEFIVRKEEFELDKAGDGIVPGKPREDVNHYIRHEPGNSKELSIIALADSPSPPITP